MSPSVRMQPEDELALRLKHAKIPHQRQVQCIPGRKFSFDFQCFNKPEDAQVLYLPSTVLVEVQGGVHMKRGGHSTGKGITRDAEKASLAAVHGFRLVVATTEHVRDGRALLWIQQALGLANG